MIQQSIIAGEMPENKTSFKGDIEGELSKV
jgi:hypothetical protein